MPSKKDINKDLLRFKNAELLSEGVPEDLHSVMTTFLKQAVILGEYDLDYMPPEYIENLLVTLSKYPEYNSLLNDLIRILKRTDIM